MVMMLFTFTACGSDNKSDNKSDTKSTATASKTSENKSGKRILIAYFSRPDENIGVGVIEKGNTRILAEMLAEETGGDLFEIKPAKSYPKAYKETTELAKREQQEKARPEIVGDLPNIDNYDVILLGYPIWWGDLPMPVYTFLEKEKFNGKTIAPFCTHEGSGIAGTEGYIEETTKANMLKGLAMRGSVAQNSKDKAREELKKWLDEISIK